MNVAIHNTYGFYDGRKVPYIEMEVLGDKHTLSVRKYPKNVSVQMWKNSDKQGTRISLKIPHNKFKFMFHVMSLVLNFETDISTSTMLNLDERWELETKLSNF